MRIVYDDTMQDEMVTAVEKFMASLDVKIVIRYERRMGSVQMNILREKLNLYLEHYRMSIGNKVTHAHCICNNCQYPVYYYPEGSDEIQQCAYINLNIGIRGEGYLSCEDYNCKKISPVYKICRLGIEKH